MTIIQNLKRKLLNEDERSCPCGNSLPWDMAGLVVVPFAEESNGYLKDTQKFDGFCSPGCLEKHADKAVHDQGCMIEFHYPQEPPEDSPYSMGLYFHRFESPEHVKQVMGYLDREYRW